VQTAEGVCRQCYGAGGNSAGRWKSRKKMEKEKAPESVPSRAVKANNGERGAKSTREGETVKADAKGIGEKACKAGESGDSGGEKGLGIWSSLKLCLG